MLDIIIRRKNGAAMADRIRLVISGEIERCEIGKKQFWFTIEKDEWLISHLKCNNFSTCPEFETNFFTYYTTEIQEAPYDDCLIHTMPQADTEESHKSR